MESQDQGGSPIPCPSESVWLEVAAGLTSEHDRERLVAHAAGCHSCADQLARGIRLMSSEETGEENAMIGSLKTAQPEWQADMARRLAEPAEIRKPFWRPMLFVALAASLLVAVVVFSLNRDAPLTQLADAYSKNREFEWRIPGAAYGPMRVHRGGPSLPLPALAQSELSIQRHLLAHPQDVPWLLAKGRAALLAGHSEEAIPVLRQALDLAPSSPALRANICVDLASAYIERAEVDGSAENLSLAVSLLGQAIQSDRTLSVAYFNRAIVLQKLGQVEAARADWERYLQLDTDGEWHDEARERLARLVRQTQTPKPGTGQ